jgi:NADPH:quinone reductase-like Zn-dependent oxidoreductase
VGLNPLDYRIRRGEMRLVTRWKLPRLLASDFSGEVIETGHGAAEFSVGQRVYGMVNQVTSGTTANVIAVPAKHLAPIPSGLETVEAAAVPLAAMTALQSLRDHGHVQEGQRVLVNGASGGVGTFGVQIARALGCHVTAVTSHRNLDLVSALGADDVIDYTATDPLAGDVRYDVIFDAYGNKSFGTARQALTPEGIYVSTIPSSSNALGMLLSLFTKQRGRVVVVRSNRGDLETLGRWIDDGVIRPVIEKTFPREQIRDAYTQLETKRAKGKLVVQMI